MKKGILVVSFGTSYEETRKKCIESIENKITETFKDYTVRRAFTSNMIIKKMKSVYQMDVDTPELGLERMIQDGITDITVQPLHIIPGFEYEKIKSAVAKANHKTGVQVKLGDPLLNTIENYHETIAALNTQMPSENEREAVLFMGHGTEHHANACYSLLQRLFDDQRKDVLIANVEGYPELDDIMPKIKGNYDKLTLMPLMLVAGDHSQNDMAGDDEDSFKSVIEAEGIKVECVLKGLGENDEIRDIFVRRIQEMME